MKKTLATVISVAFVLVLAAPVFAMTHTAEYIWDATGEMQRQVGHFCNTGAEQKVAISGDGYMERVSDVTMSKGELNVEETSDFVTAEDAAENLTVTSVIELCSPPKIWGLTDQIWAVQVEANPVMSGNMQQEFDAAYGDAYVGNYFHMDQVASTSDGELKRYIDISSPFTGAYLHENFEGSGEFDIEEEFTMDNVSPRGEPRVVWHDLF